MAKTGLAGIAEGRTDLFRMDPRKIVVKEGWNSRDFEDPDNQAHVEALAASIREVGVKEPLSGFLEDEKFVLTNGESRYRAVMLLLEQGVEIKTVPVMAEPRHASEADHVASQFIRNSGRPFTPMENSKLFVRLLDLGWSEKEIAEKTGMTTERVQQIARLNTLPGQVKDYIRKGRISTTLVQRIQAKAASAGEITSKVKQAIAAAKADGKDKATPKHVEKSAPKPKSKGKTNYRELFEELMSYVDIEPHEIGDVNGEPSTELVVRLPTKRWDAMKAVSKTQGTF